MRGVRVLAGVRVIVVQLSYICDNRPCRGDEGRGPRVMPVGVPIAALAQGARLPLPPGWTPGLVLASGGEAPPLLCPACSAPKQVAAG